METHKFMHTLDGIIITIKADSKIGAEAILEKLVQKFKDWTYYK
jgi:hypothetical protein